MVPARETRPKSEPVYVRFDVETDKALRDLANKNIRPLSTEIRLAVDAHLKAQARKGKKSRATA